MRSEKLWMNVTHSSIILGYMEVFLHIFQNGIDKSTFFLYTIFNNPF